MTSLATYNVLIKLMHARFTVYDLSGECVLGGI